MGDTKAVVHVNVCVTCVSPSADGTQLRPGQELHRCLQERLAGDSNVVLHAVECLSVCRRPCTVGFSAPGKWSYIVGDLHPIHDADAVLTYAQAYAASEAGTLPLSMRPEAIRRGTIARIPSHGGA